MIQRLLCLLVAVALSAGAAVQRIAVLERGPVLAGRTFGGTGAYEYIRGVVHFAVSPGAAVNRNIADLALAPRNSQGQVEFTADFYILQPRNGERANGTTILEVSNRGGKGLLNTFSFGRGPVRSDNADSIGDGFLFNKGFTLAWVGWEFDVPDAPGILRLDAPVATDHGKPITGMIHAEWTGDQRTEIISLGDRSQRAYPVADDQDPANAIYVRDTVYAKPQRLPRESWRFTDPTHVALDSGFTPGRIYDVVYRAKNPVVAGLGFAAIRDFASYLKHPPTLKQPAEGDELRQAQRVLGFGISQDGRFLRSLLYQGFNTDEQGRPVFDGVWAQVGGGGRGSFNERFAQPSRDGHPFLNVFYPVDVPPFDTASLLKPEQKTNSVPKLFLTNGSYEYWGRCASLTHTTADSKQDVAPPAGTREYFLAGSQHTTGSIPPGTPAAQHPASAVDYRPAMRALLVAMQNWLTRGTEPPPSQVPLLAKQSLVALDDLHFPAIPQVTVPRYMKQAYELDLNKLPPTVSKTYIALVPQVDIDGNEISGIRVPEVAVPLATYTGWNQRAAAIGAPDQLFSMVGSYLPFPITEAERAAKHDPRRSIESRYHDENEYLQKIKSASMALVGQGYLLEEDLPRIADRASEEWAYAHR